MAFEIEELKELREHNRVLHKEVSDQRSQIDALTLRLHVLKSKQNKPEVDKKEDATKKIKEDAVSSSSMAAREMLMDSSAKGDSDSDNEKQIIIDKLKKKISNLEKTVRMCYGFYQLRKNINSKTCLDTMMLVCFFLSRCVYTSMNCSNLSQAACNIWF